MCIPPQKDDTDIFLVDAMKEAISALEAMQNPVVYRYKDAFGRWQFVENELADSYKGCGYKVEPLYALPAPPKVEQEE